MFFESSKIPLQKNLLYLYLYFLFLYLLVNSFLKAVISLTAASKIGCMDTLRDYGIQKRDLFKPFRRERNEQKTL